ncbi:GntR family transcriptional regulator [Streptomyces sp. 7-21]|uniref:GntR family transcriptional regulator n=1 Tax=Streptomyces sp. 7-21 TaxID=2802283 RepID=UPI00191FFD41|nr:GntR family transcriptional regulator [Streptomyces sp. 7-21]MBL1065980.1 GntR family transcriptional regulator [Streptomyces sp. 7-21]
MWQTVADDLRRRIADGEWPPGRALPPPQELRRRYAAEGPGALRQALAVLVAEGLIAVHPGQGPYVRSPRRRIRRECGSHQWEKDRARASDEIRRGTGATERQTGLAVTDLVFSIDYAERRASGELAAAFGVAPGTPLVERVYRTRCATEPVPMSLVRSYLVREHVAANPDLLSPACEPWPGGTQAQLLTVGIELDRVVERVTGARPPTREEAALLGMGPGMAVLLLRKTCVDTAGRVVEVADVTLPGDRAEFVCTTRLARW